MLLAKTTNLDTGAQSEAFIVCGNCYQNLDDAIGVAKRKNGTDIAICEVAEDVAGTCENCQTDD